MTESESFCKRFLALIMIILILIAIDDIPVDDIDKTRIKELREDIKNLEEKGNTDNQNRINRLQEELKLIESRTGLLTQAPDYSGNPTLSREGATYKLEDNSRCHEIIYKDGLYICKRGSSSYVLGNNLTKPITNDYHDIYVPWWGFGTVYGKLGNQAGPIGHI